MPNPDVTLCIKCAKSTDCRRCRWDGRRLDRLPEGAQYKERQVTDALLYCVTSCPDFEAGRVDIRAQDIQDENLLRLIERFGEEMGINYRNALLSSDYNTATVYAREIRNSYLLACAGINTTSVVEDLKAQAKSIKRAVGLMAERDDTDGIKRLMERFPDSADCIKALASKEPYTSPVRVYEEFTSFCRYYDIRNQDKRSR